MMRFMNEWPTVGCILVAITVFAGCDFGGSPLTLDKSVEIESCLPMVAVHDTNLVDQDLEQPFEKVAPALRGVRIARSRLLRIGATIPDDTDNLRTSSKSYREALQYLRHQLLEIEQEDGLETMRRLVGLIITSGFVFSPEVFGDLDVDSSSKATSVRQAS